MPLGERDEIDAVEGEVLVEGGGVGLVTRDAIESFSDNNVESSAGGLMQNLLVTRRKNEAPLSALSACVSTSCHPWRSMKDVQLRI